MPDHVNMHDIKLRAVRDVSDLNSYDYMIVATRGNQHIGVAWLNDVGDDHPGPWRLYMDGVKAPSLFDFTQTALAWVMEHAIVRVDEILTREGM